MFDRIIDPQVFDLLIELWLYGFQGKELSLIVVVIQNLIFGKAVIHLQSQHRKPHNLCQCLCQGSFTNSRRPFHQQRLIKGKHAKYGIADIIRRDITCFL